MIGKQDI